MDVDQLILLIGWEKSIGALNENNNIYIAKMDCVIIATDHSCYDYKMIEKEVKLIVDSRNAMVKAGIKPHKKIITL